MEDNSVSDSKNHLKNCLQDKAHQLGFAQCRIMVPTKYFPAGEALQSWLAQQFHGSMAWMENPLRQNPVLLWNEVRSIIVLGMNYGPTLDDPLTQPDKSRGLISIYARGRDYHDVLKGKLKHLGHWLARQSNLPLKVFVDTAPIMEKPLAQQAGLGWQGKHTNVVSRHYGSWLFLGLIFTEAELEPDASEQDHCGKCQNCLNACPTKAFVKPYLLDARACISYLTIEHQGMIDQKFRKAMGNHIYGCDDCLAACPWNKFALAAHETKLQARSQLQAPKLVELLQFNDLEFRQFFAGGPIKRIGYRNFMRNVLIAAGNSNDNNLISFVRRFLSHSESLLRASALWTLARLSINEFLTTFPNLDANEELIVQQEWQDLTAQVHTKGYI